MARFRNLLFSPTAPKCGVYLAVALLASFWVDTARAEITVSAEARAHFEAGVGHLQSDSPDRYDEAYREFKAAYKVSPTWKILGNLGITAHKLERHGEAIDAFEEYLDKGQGELSAREAEQVRKDLERARSEQATVTLEAGRGPLWIVDTRLNTDGSPIVNQYGPFDGRVELRVRAGKHEFGIDRPGASAPAWTVTLLAGDTSTHSFDFSQSMLTADFEAAAAAPDQSQRDVVDSPKSLRPVAYVLWGTGVAAAGATVVLYLQSNRLQKDADATFERRCPFGVIEADAGCVRTTAGDTKAANWRTATLMTGIGAAGALITGTAFYWLDASPSSGGSRKEGPRPDAASVRPWISPAGVGVTGTF